MRDWFKKVSQEVEKLKLWENILKHFTSSKLHRKNRNFRDMVMS